MKSFCNEPEGVSLAALFSAKKKLFDMIYIRQFNFSIPLDGGQGRMEGNP
jgi:hypothetical protein